MPILRREFFLLPRLIAILLIGSSVVNALLAEGTFTPRAITRNPASENAKKLAAKGVEVVKADLWDKTTIKQAINGSEGVFLVRRNVLTMI